MDFGLPVGILGFHYRSLETSVEQKSSVDPALPVRILIFQYECRYSSEHWSDGNSRIPIRILGFQGQYCQNAVTGMLKYYSNVVEILRQGRAHSLKIYYESYAKAEILVIFCGNLERVRCEFRKSGESYVKNN